MCMSLITGCRSSDSEVTSSVVEKPFSYIETEQKYSELDAAITKAKNEDKLFLLVLGAYWCHDSEGLIDNFNKPELNRIINNGFVSLFIDVGNYEDNRDILARFNYPAYFATPTVLIIDPVNEQLLNESSLRIWQSADSVPYEEYLAYFANAAQKGSSSQTPVPYHQQLQKFSETQTQRLVSAYAKLSPLMVLEERNQLEDKQVFYDLWGEVRDYRNTLQKDLHALREEVRDNPNVNLTLPSYDAFSWE